jgi:hypothetical protein
MGRFYEFRVLLSAMPLGCVGRGATTWTLAPLPPLRHSRRPLARKRTTTMTLAASWAPRRTSSRSLTPAAKVTRVIWKAWTWRCSNLPLRLTELRHVALSAADTVRGKWLAGTAPYPGRCTSSPLFRPPTVVSIRTTSLTPGLKHFVYTWEGNTFSGFKAQIKSYPCSTQWKRVLPVRYEHSLDIKSKAIPVTHSGSMCFLWGTNTV